MLLFYFMIKVFLSLSHNIAEDVSKKVLQDLEELPPLSFHPLETFKKVKKLFGSECLGDSLFQPVLT